MRLIVTGSAGLVGSQLVRALRALGDTVIEIDRRGSGGQVCDFASAPSLRLVDSSIDGVLHLAAVSRVAWGEADPELCQAINVERTARLLDRMLEAAPRAWFLFGSSREVYGEARARLIKEDDPLAPVNVYGCSKRDGEALVQAARGRGLATATLRLCIVYGGREDHPDRAVPALVAAAVAGAPLRLTGGETYFDFVHVEDVVSGILLAIDALQGGVRVHLASGRATSLRRLADMVVEAADSTSAIEILPPRDFDVSGFCGSPDRAAEELNWRAGIVLKEGLQRTIAGFRAHGPLRTFRIGELRP